MNNNQNSAGKTLFKLAGAAAIIALILSISRLFLSTSDRGMTEFFTYNLAYSSQMAAFLSVIMIAILLVIIGSLLSKEYDIFGTPMVIGGILSLIYVTAAAYLIQSFSRGVGDNVALGEFVLTAIIAVEWFMLVIFAWRMDSETENQTNSQVSNQSTNNPTPPPVQPENEMKI